MKILNTSGTLGDTYVNCCKLYSLNEKIKIFHSQPYPKFNNSIKTIYTLIPNIIEINMCNHYKNICDPKYPYMYSLCKKGLGDPEFIKMNFFPNFQIKSKYIFDFPYIVLQPKSGRKELKKEFRLKTVKKIIENSKYKVILIGTSEKYKNIKNCINLINKTSIFDAFYIIKNSKYLIGFFGIMTMFALSQKINCNFIYINEKELELRIYNTPWEKYCMKKITLNQYLLSQKSFLFQLKRILLKYYKKIVRLIPYKKIIKIQKRRIAHIFIEIRKKLIS